jgi:hypothetical protein
MKDRKRPQYIEKQLEEINDVLRSIRLKFDDKYNNDLFNWYTSYLSKNGWYRGFNMHYDQEIRYADGTVKVIRALAGPDYEKKDYYIQIW